MKEKQREFVNKWLILLMVNIAVIFLTCNLMLNMHFSPDTYDILTTTDNNVDVHLRDGRFVTAALYKILSVLGVNVAKCQEVFTVVFMMTAGTLTTWLTYLSACRAKRADMMSLIVFDACFLLIFHNAFIAEWYLFPEVMLMYAISILSVVYSVVLYLRGSNLNNSKPIVRLWHVLATLLLLTIALGTYQVSIGIYVAILFILLLVDVETPIRRRVIISGGGLVIGAFGCIANVAIVKVLEILRVMAPTPRGANLSISAIAENVGKIIEKQPTIWSGHGIFPRYMLLTFFTLIIVTLLVLKRLHRLQGSTIAGIVGCASCIYVGSFIPHYVTSDFWLSQRTLVPIFAVFSFLLIAIVVIDQSFRTKCFAAIISVTFLLGNSLIMENIFSSHLTMDALDVSYAKAIHSYIESYTQETRIAVDNLAIGRDASPMWSYTGVEYVTYDINVKNVLRSWSNIGLINTANGTDYQSADMDDEVWRLYFDGKNWDSFYPEEQIVFDGNTAYIVVY